MTFLPRDAYATALVDAIAHAKNHVILAAMVFDAEHPMSTVVGALLEAKARGVEVILYIDVFTKINTYDEIGFLQAARKRQGTKHALNQLESAGVTVKWLGKLGANPYKRRFHQKFSIIDGKDVFFGGGINLTGESFQFHDFMFRWQDTALAAILRGQLERIYTEGTITDSEHELDSNHTLLLDGGQPDSSIIYTQALQLAEKAKSIVFVSQMAPSGKLAKVLRHKQVTYYLNSPFAMSLVSGASELLTQRIHRYQNQYHGKRYIHAKCMLFSLPDNSKIVLAGSHNFNERGVRYGTKELALLSDDPLTVAQIEDFTAQLS